MATMKNKIEVLPGKFIKYEISQELIDELRKEGIVAEEVIEFACKHAEIYKDILEDKK